MIEAALIRAVSDRLGLEMRSGKLLTGLTGSPNMRAAGW
jgi:hypothetical protein